MMENILKWTAGAVWRLTEDYRGLPKGTKIKVKNRTTTTARAYHPRTGKTMKIARTVIQHQMEYVSGGSDVYFIGIKQSDVVRFYDNSSMGWNYTEVPMVNAHPYLGEASAFAGLVHWRASMTRIYHRGHPTIIKLSPDGTTTVRELSQAELNIIEHRHAVHVSLGELPASRKNHEMADLMMNGLDVVKIHRGYEDVVNQLPVRSWGKGLISISPEDAEDVYAMMHLTGADFTKAILSCKTI